MRNRSGDRPTSPSWAARASNFGVPNQEVGNNECVPGAISNSLKFLQMQGLKLPDDKISIDAIKPATGWTPAGAPTHGTGPHGRQRRLAPGYPAFWAKI